MVAWNPSRKSVASVLQKRLFQDRKVYLDFPVARLAFTGEHIKARLRIYHQKNASSDWPTASSPSR